jgi:hypothetical protein
VSRNAWRLAQGSVCTLAFHRLSPCVVSLVASATARATETHRESASVRKGIVTSERS